MPEGGNIVFPYGIKFSGDGAINIFPAARIELPTRNGECISVIFIVDSGAAVSVLPKGDADFLGIDLAEGKEILVAGIGAIPLRGVQLEVGAFFGLKKIKIPIVFIDGDKTPRVLGRAGIFDRFMIIFEESKKRTSFFGRNTAAWRSITKIIDRDEPSDN